MSGAVPNALDRRVTSTSHSVYCVIRTVDVNDNSPSALASHLALRHFGRRSALQKDGLGRRSALGRRPAFQKRRPQRANCQPDHQECSGSGDRPHFHPLDTRLRETQGRLEFVSKLLKCPSFQWRHRVAHLTEARTWQQPCGHHALCVRQRVTIGRTIVLFPESFSFWLFSAVNWWNLAERVGFEPTVRTTAFETGAQCGYLSFERVRRSPRIEKRPQAGSSLRPLRLGRP